jgi:hypothetical protein
LGERERKRKLEFLFKFFVIFFIEKNFISNLKNIFRNDEYLSDELISINIFSELAHAKKIYISLN